MKNILINSVITQNLTEITPDGHLTYTQQATQSIYCNYEIWYITNEEAGLVSDFCNSEAVHNTFEECYVEAHKIADTTNLLKEDNAKLIISHCVGIKQINGNSYSQSSDIVEVLPDGQIKLLSNDLKKLYKEFIK